MISLHTKKNILNQKKVNELFKLGGEDCPTEQELTTIFTIKSK